MMMKLRVVGSISVLIATIACGGGSGGVTGPSGPTIPTVSGNYSGTVNIVLPELGQSMSCPASTVVTQSGSTVNIAPMVVTGQCAGYSIPLGQTTIDSTGAFVGGTATGTFSDPSCGTYNYNGSGGFFGREFRMSLTATSATCWNFNFTSSLSR